MTHRALHGLLLTPAASMALLAACSDMLPANESAYAPIYPIPSAAQVARAEARLAQHPCVGSLDRWDRVYAYAINPGRGQDFDRMTFSYNQAGFEEFVSGWRADVVSSEIDDRRYQMVAGQIDIQTGQYEVWVCSTNPELTGIVR